MHPTVTIVSEGVFINSSLFVTSGETFQDIWSRDGVAQEINLYPAYATDENRSSENGSINRNQSMWIS